MVILLLPVLACTGPSDTSAPVSGLPEGFHVGVNYPWRSYGSDFGTNAWGVGGVAQHEDEVAADFAAMADAGVAVVRWFVLTDGRGGLVFDDSMPSALQPETLADLDKAVDLAEASGLVLVPSLIDFWWLSEPVELAGVQLGGHADVIGTAEGREALIEAAIRPLTARYGQRQGIGAWEIINEPEWAIDGIGGGWLGDAVPLDAMQRFVAEAAAAIHQEADQPVTVGSASVAHARTLWVSQGLDLLQVHSYDGAALSTDAAEVSQLPCIVGELGTAAKYGDLSDNIAAVEARGYGGVWLWSLRAEDDASDLDLEAL